MKNRNALFPILIFICVILIFFLLRIIILSDTSETQNISISSEESIRHEEKLPENSSGESLSDIISDTKPEEYHPYSLDGTGSGAVNAPDGKTESIRSYWKEVYPKANVICFEIDCHDGKKHIFGGTDGMPLNVWLNSKYNAEGWEKKSGDVVNKEGTKYILYERSAASIVLHEGIILDTADLITEND